MKTRSLRVVAACLFLGSIACPAIADEKVEDLGWSIDAGIAHDDNVTRGKLESDRLPDRFATINVSKSYSIATSPNSRLIVGGTLGGQSFQTYKKLNNVSVTVDAELQYRASSEFSEPTYGLFVKAGFDDYESFARDSSRYAIGLSWRKPITDRIAAFAALSANTRRAQSAVFTTGDGSARVNLDYTLSNTKTIYLGAEYRDGDIVSTGRSSLENVTIAKVLVADDAFSDLGLFSYRMKGTTAIATLGYNMVVSGNSSLDFSWRYVESTPEVRPTWATSPKSYVTNQVFASYLVRF